MRISSRSRLLKFENKAREDGFVFIIGVDEAGRGPLAGPVVASAVALKENFKFKSRVCDSKQLTPEQRVSAYHEIFENAYVGIGVMSETVIDEHNILNATFFAMTNAVNQLMARLPAAMTQSPDFGRKVCLLIDGNCFKADLPYAFQTIIDGDSLSLSIAAGSIVAKVTRDRILNTYHRIFPHYGFSQHKGYSTPEHRANIREHGLSLIHRKSFNSVDPQYAGNEEGF
jgi:ribonuclease HII